jgi:hypothetical protein
MVSVIAHGGDKVPRYPNATWDPITGMPGLRTWRGPGGLPKIVFHTTEGPNKPDWQAKMSGVPHFTHHRKTGECWQHLDFDVAAYTMMAGDYSPNSDGGVTIQIEIIGYAKDSPTWTQDECDNLMRLVSWIAEQIDCPVEFPHPFDGEDAYGENGSVRLSWEEWRATTGIVGHQHAPWNGIRWDPGKIPVEKLAVEDAMDYEKLVEDVAARVNLVLGDHNAKGEPNAGNENPERAAKKIREIENVVRRVEEKVDRVLAVLATIDEGVTATLMHTRDLDDLVLVRQPKDDT